MRVVLLQRDVFLTDGLPGYAVDAGTLANRLVFKTDFGFCVLGVEVKVCAVGNLLSVNMRPDERRICAGLQVFRNLRGRTVFFLPYNRRSRYLIPQSFYAYFGWLTVHLERNFPVQSELRKAVFGDEILAFDLLDEPQRFELLQVPRKHPVGEASTKIARDICKAAALFKGECAEQVGVAPVQVLAFAPGLIVGQSEKVC
jgi:hypothetical protein